MTRALLIDHDMMTSKVYLEIENESKICLSAMARLKYN